MQAMKSWSDLSAEDQEAKVKAIGKALVDNGLDTVHPKIISQCIYDIQNAKLQDQCVMTVEGKLSVDKKGQADAFKQSAAQILKGLNPRTAVIDISCQLKQGDQYEEITDITDLHKKVTSIPHKQGQVILIDFWATWCPPCQKPMAHNQHMLETRGKDWGDKVRICGISIDQTTEAVVTHIKKEKWQTVEHFHRGASTASQTYGSNGVPHVVLVDTNGKIVFIGHPASRSLEQDIDALLKGETLKGKGTTAAGKDDEGEEGGYKAMDTAKVDAEIAAFKKKVPELGANPTVKKHAADLIRSFVVLVKQSKMDPRSGDLLTQFQNIRVLVGKTADVDVFEKEVGTFMTSVGNSFEVVNRIQKM